MKADLLSWHSLMLTWFCCCNTLKMTLLPKVLYLLQGLPIRLPPMFFKQVNSLFWEFVWFHRKLHLQLLPKRQGEVGLPDVRAYYRVTRFTRMVDWHCHAEAKHWVAMELEDSGDTAKSCPWITSQLPSRHFSDFSE